VTLTMVGSVRLLPPALEHRVLGAPLASTSTEYRSPAPTPGCLTPQRSGPILTAVLPPSSAHGHQAVSGPSSGLATLAASLPPACGSHPFRESSDGFLTPARSQGHLTPQLVRQTSGLGGSTSQCVLLPSEFATVTTPRSLEPCESLRSISIVSSRPADGFASPAPSKSSFGLGGVSLHPAGTTSFPASPALTPRDTTPLVRPYCESVSVPRGFSTPAPPALHPPPTPGHVTAELPGCGTDGLRIHELQIGSEGFDPNRPLLKSQITSKLGVAGGSVIAALHGRQGALNEGVWMLQDPCSGAELIMKLVKDERREVDRYLRLAKSHPSVVNDSSLSFPLLVFRCLGAGCGRAYDLLVMRRASGQRLDHLISAKVSNGHTADLSKILANVGASLAELHKRYGNSQHGDCQPSNVFYDDTTSRVTFIDVSDLGLSSLESDTEHFTEALRLLSRHYGQQFFTASLHDFEAGYFRGRHCLLNL